MSITTATPPLADALTADLTVNQVAERVPASLAVFQRWGIDACCGGAKTLATVAERHGFDLEALLGELNAAAR